MTEQTQGIYFGIGAYVSMDSETNLPKISGVIEGAPAADVDLRANDIIYEVDGVSTAGKTLTEADVFLGIHDYEKIFEALEASYAGNERENYVGI